jgi:hypothetical protein
MTTVPAVIVISSPAFAIDCSSLRLHPSNSGTVARWATLSDFDTMAEP